MREIARTVIVENFIARMVFTNMRGTAPGSPFSACAAPPRRGLTHFPVNAPSMADGRKLQAPERFRGDRCLGTIANYGRRAT